MIQEAIDFVIPLYRVRWNTRAVLEGLTTHYRPRTIHVVTPKSQAGLLAERAQVWQIAPLYTYEEETFFHRKNGLTKESICAELIVEESLYRPGWFYQQLLKLGASEGIEGLNEWYVVWDSDLLPVSPWSLLGEGGQHTFALLQNNQWGNAQIVSTWAEWIRSVLGVEPLTDSVGTFIPHHIWFKQEHLESFKRQLSVYFQSDTSWLLLMMRSANQFGTFSEYWSYASWVAARAPADLAFHPYEKYGATTERFFDDGTGRFSAALQRYQSLMTANEGFSPPYAEVEAFIRAEYGTKALPSSLSFESSPRHLQKQAETMHIEEFRSRWNPRSTEVSSANI
ncbi:MAG: DUF6492 family protein [Cyanophyceae cyanobacterium]